MTLWFFVAVIILPLALFGYSRQPRERLDAWVVRLDLNHSQKLGKQLHPLAWLTPVWMVRYLAYVFAKTYVFAWLTAWVILLGGWFDFGFHININLSWRTPNMVGEFLRVWLHLLAFSCPLLPGYMQIWHPVGGKTRPSKLLWFWLHLLVYAALIIWAASWLPRTPRAMSPYDELEYVLRSGNYPARIRAQPQASQQ